MPELLSPLKVFFDNLRIRRPRAFGDWMREEMTVVEGQSAGLLYAPRGWQKLIVPVMEQRAHVWLSTPPRAGKTLLAVGKLLYHAFECGDTVQIGAPTAEIASGFWFDKILPVIMANPRLKAQIAFDPSLRTLRAVYRLRTGGVFRVVFNPKQIRSYDAAVLVCTEAATFEETPNETDALTLLQKRQDDWPHQGIQFFESTQRDDLTRFAREIAAGTDSRIECKCKCRKWFEAGAREHFQWQENGEDCDPVIVCPHCGAKYPEKKRARLLKHIRIRDTRPDAFNFTLTVNWLHTRRTFAEVAALEKRYKEAGEIAVLRDLLQNYYATPTRRADELAFMASGALISKQGLLERRTGLYTRDTLPPDTVMCVGAIDCQQDWLYTLLAAFDAAGTLSLVHWGTVKILEREQQHQGIVASPDRVRGALNAAYDRLSAHHPAGIWIDTSYKSAASQTPIITEWARGKPGVYKVRGRTDRQIQTLRHAAALPPAVASLIKPYRASDGTIDMFLNTTQLKNQLMAMILREPGSGAGFRLPGDLDPTDGGDTALLLHLTAEEPLQKKDGTVEWQKRFGHTGRNDWWDCLVYAYCGLLYQQALSAPPPPAPRPKALPRGLSRRAGAFM